MHYLTVVLSEINVSKNYTHTYPALFVSLGYIQLHHCDINSDSMILSYLKLCGKTAFINILQYDVTLFRLFPSSLCFFYRMLHTCSLQQHFVKSNLECCGTRHHVIRTDDHLFEKIQNSAFLSKYVRRPDDLLTQVGVCNLPIRANGTNYLLI